MDEARCPSSLQRKLLLEISKLPDGRYQVRPRQYPAWADASRLTHGQPTPVAPLRSDGRIRGFCLGAHLLAGAT